MTMPTENRQSTDIVLMISPDTFQFNPQTAKTNVFQNASYQVNRYQEKVKQEFEHMVAALRAIDIRVIILPSRQDVITPDAVFPNNWFSIHSLTKNNVMLVLYPILAENRRAERQVDALQSALQNHHIHITQVIDLTDYEQQQKYLEGTGSMVLDRLNRIVYAALSPRTDIDVLNKFASIMHYHPVTFHSYDNQMQPVYHTNVMMSVGTNMAIINADSITDAIERDTVLNSLAKSQKEMILITQEQMYAMAGNMLELCDGDGKTKIIMSQTAHEAFTPQQRNQLEQHAKIVTVDIPVIESMGGGSARCMLAEIFY
jgi:hypothetical protein